MRRQKRGSMDRQGILFQGLRVRDVSSASFLREEFSYPLQISAAKESRADITYFLLFVMCRNFLCRSKVRGLKKEWETYLYTRAKESPYQGCGFWLPLDKDERRCARLLLGMLEDIRTYEDDRAEKAWISFWYLVRCAFREIYEFLKNAGALPFSELCRFAADYADIPFMGTAYLCMMYLIAEDTGVKILENGRVFLLYSCIKTGNRLWETDKDEISKRC